MSWFFVRDTYVLLKCSRKSEDAADSLLSSTSSWCLRFLLIITKALYCLHTKVVMMVSVYTCFSHVKVSISWNEENEGMRAKEKYPLVQQRRLRVWNLDILWKEKRRSRFTYITLVEIIINSKLKATQFNVTFRRFSILCLFFHVCCQTLLIWLNLVINYEMVQTETDKKELLFSSLNNMLLSSLVTFSLYVCPKSWTERMSTLPPTTPLAPSFPLSLRHHLWQQQ